MKSGQFGPSTAARVLCTALLVAMILPVVLSSVVAETDEEFRKVDNSRNYVDRAFVGYNNFHSHKFVMDKGDVLEFRVTVLNGSAVDIMVFIERDFNIYRNAGPGDDLYAEKKLLDVTNITREYRETGNFGPYNIYLVVDNTNVTAGATPVGNVLVEIEAHLESESDDDSPGFLSGYTFAAVIAAAAAALPVRKNGNR